MSVWAPRHSARVHAAPNRQAVEETGWWLAVGRCLHHSVTCKWDRTCKPFERTEPFVVGEHMLSRSKFGKVERGVLP